jgi:hypothetical protein
MSAIKIDTKNIMISENEIARSVLENKRFEEYSDDKIKEIAFEAIEKCKKAMISSSKENEINLDDEELFDETYDYILKKAGKELSSADIAYIVNDVFMQVEDMLFDQGKLQYE